MIDFIGAASGLKSIARQGWIDGPGIPHPESVADHSYVTCVMAMAFGDLLGLDGSKMVRMALLHDLAESITGDITPSHKSAGRKNELERCAIKKILSGVPDVLRLQYMALWDEFTCNETAESKMLHELDKLEMAIQASAYSAKFPDRSFSSFVETARMAVRTPELRALLAEYTGGRKHTG